MSVFVVLVAGLFGHHHLERSLLDGWPHAVAQWVGAHWTALAVLVPLVGALVGAIVNHRLALARENRRRQIDRSDVAERVRRELAARLIVHADELRAAVKDPTGVDLESLRRANAALRSRAEADDVVATLGARYVAFTGALDRERRALGRLNGDAKNDVRTICARAILEFVPYIAESGEPERAATLRAIGERYR